MEFGGAVGGVEQAAIGRAAARGVEGHHPAVAVAVFLHSREPAAVVMFDARDAAVTPGRHVDADDRTVGAGIRPGVLRAVPGSRKPTLSRLRSGR